MEIGAPKQGNEQRRGYFTFELSDQSGVVDARHILQGAGVGHDPAPGSPTSFVDNGGLKLNHVQVQLIFWGAAWNAFPQPVPTVNEVDAAVITIMHSSYMLALAQYGVGS